MYARDTVNAACMVCHPGKDLGHKRIHRPYLDDTAQIKKVCADCHGDHRLAKRSVRWDKKTRKLLPEEKK